MTRSPRALSRELRKGRDPALTRRPDAGGAAAVARGLS